MSFKKLQIITKNIEIGPFLIYKRKLNYKQMLYWNCVYVHIFWRLWLKIDDLDEIKEIN